MNRGSWGVLVVAVLVVGLTATCLAGAMYRNDSGAVARAVRIEFSEPAEITSMWPSFPQRDPQGPATVVVLGGGEIPAGGWFSVSWRPDTARVVKIEWFGSPPSSARPNVGFSDPKPKPEVHGELLNPAFFAHPAYVMQGVSDRDEVFALPLHGVPELALYPVLGDLPASSLTWTLEVSHPEGIGAAIEDGMLYIWGNNPEWQGYGAVELHVSTPDGRSGWVVIPVVVFCRDRTLVNPQGKKDYFVPWGVVLDINRILSTEEHMRQYSKPDLGLLDRTLRFSRWRLMEYRADLDVSTLWSNELVTGGDWTMATQFALVDVLLAEAVAWGINGIRVQNEYLVSSLGGTEMVPIYDRWNAGPTKRPEEVGYLVCEAHRLGLSVIMGNVIGADTRDGYFELYDICPISLTAFVTDWEELNRQSLMCWVKLGVDVVQVCAGLDTICGNRQKSSAEARSTSDAVEHLATAARAYYPGPLYHRSEALFQLFPGESVATAPFWYEFDIVALQLYAQRLTPFDSPTLAQLVAGWNALIVQHIQPFLHRINRPLLAHDVGTFAADGCANWGPACNAVAGSGYDASRPSLAHMELYYLSHHEAFRELEGYFGPGWHIYALQPTRLGSVRDAVDTTPRMKVEHVLQRMYLGEVQPRVITIDGNFGDWREEYVIGTDRIGDLRGRNDLTGLSFTQDDDYWYFKIDYAVPLGGRSFLSIDMDLTGSGHRDVFVLLNNVFGDWWQNATIYPGHPGPLVGFADAIDAESSLEVRVPKRFLADLLTHEQVRVRLVHADSDWRVEDETSWFTLPHR